MPKGKELVGCISLIGLIGYIRNQNVKAQMKNGEISGERKNEL
jgi:hypothetical protein